MVNHNTDTVTLDEDPISLELLLLTRTEKSNLYAFKTRI